MKGIIDTIEVNSKRADKVIKPIKKIKDLLGDKFKIGFNFKIKEWKIFIYFLIKKMNTQKAYRC